MKNKKEEPKKIKFNFYWIYAIIAVLFFGVQILNINTISETSWQEFNRKMLQNKEVEKIVVKEIIRCVVLPIKYIWVDNNKPKSAFLELVEKIITVVLIKIIKEKSSFKNFS